MICIIKVYYKMLTIEYDAAHNLTFIYNDTQKNSIIIVSMCNNCWKYIFKFIFTYCYVCINSIYHIHGCIEFKNIFFNGRNCWWVIFNCAMHFLTELKILFNKVWIWNSLNMLACDSHSNIIYGCLIVLLVVEIFLSEFDSIFKICYN